METLKGASGAAVHIRRPDRRDGSAVWRLVREAGGLDLNSAYAYILLCDRFAETCAIAEADGRTCGFVSAFLQPGRADTLFVWQIAVSPADRGQGIGFRLLEQLLTRPDCNGVRFVEATISPANRASQALFRRLAEKRGVRCQTSASEGYAASMFPDGTAHEDEWLLRVGPL